jgi:sulfite reductase (NADPH) flavoprotein alpha-component
LRSDVCLGPARDALFRLFSYITGGQQRQLALALAAGEDPDGDAAALDVLGALRKFAGVSVRPAAEAVLDALDPMRPRRRSETLRPGPHARGCP